jgi:hypothetical protein
MPAVLVGRLIRAGSASSRLRACVVTLPSERIAILAQSAFRRRPWLLPQRLLSRISDSSDLHRSVRHYCGSTQLRGRLRTSCPHSSREPVYTEHRQPHLASCCRAAFRTRCNNSSCLPLLTERRLTMRCSEWLWARFRRLNCLHSLFSVIDSMFQFPPSLILSR